MYLSDSTTKNKLIKILSADSTTRSVGIVFADFPRRRTIPAFNGYQQLALTYEYARAMKMWYGLSDTHYIISPFLADDPALKYPKDELISHICQMPEFNKLTNYVLDHHADPTRYTKEDIIKAYKRLISECYDVIHEDDTSKGESEGE